MATQGSGLLPRQTQPSFTISLDGVAGLGDVSGPGSSSDNAVARFDGTTGKIVQNSVVLISDTGDITGVASVNGGALGDVVGPGSATDESLVRFNGATGKLVQNSSARLTDAGDLTTVSLTLYNGLGWPNSPLTIYVDDTWDRSWSGPIAATAVSPAFVCCRIGKAVHVTVKAFDATGISVAALLSNTVALPPEYRPPGNVNCIMSAKDNGPTVACSAVLLTSGIVNIGRLIGDPPAAQAFSSGTGACGIAYDFTFSYVIA